MLMNRTSLVTCAAVTMLVVAGSTAAEAGGRFFSAFCHRGFPSVGRSYVPVSEHRVASKVVRHRDDDDDDRHSNSDKRHRAAAAPVKPVSVATAAASIPAAAATSSCLTKEYLDTGAVMFRDTCTKEWAMNSTNVDNKVSKAVATCLTKDNAENGIVMFKDVCTNEWAMNTQEQQAQDPQVR